MDIKNRAAIVTGAASGIGRAMARALAREGARVIVADLDERGSDETVRLITGAGGEAAFGFVDVTSEPEVSSVLRFARERFGGLDILCNNAGIGEQPDELFAEGDAWQRLVAINFTAVILGTRLGVRAMREHGTGGVIVNTASMGGLLPMPSAPVYAATKAGVVNFTRSLAYLKDEANIRVCAICPSFVDTPLLWSQGARDQIEATAAAIGGPLQPELVAEGLVELVRDDSRAGAIMRVTQARGIDYARDIRP